MRFVKAESLEQYNYGPDKVAKGDQPWLRRLVSITTNWIKNHFD